MSAAGFLPDALPGYLRRTSMPTSGGLGRLVVEVAPESAIAVDVRLLSPRGNWCGGVQLESIEQARALAAEILAACDEVEAAQIPQGDAVDSDFGAWRDAGGEPIRRDQAIDARIDDERTERAFATEAFIAAHEPQVTQRAAT